MIVFFLVPFYAVAAVAFGRIDPIFGTASPEWNPLQWDFTVASNTLDEVFNGPLRTVYLRTFLYVGLALAICVVIGYPVAYYVSRRAGRTKGLLLVAAHPAVLGQLPVADARLDRAAPARGWVNDALGRARHLRRAAVVAQREPDGGRDRPRLRLPAVLHPAAVRQPRPARPALDRSGPRPRGTAARGVPASDAAAVDARASWPRRCSPRCRCSATTTRTRSCRVAQDGDDRQPDPVLRAELEAAAEGRGARAHAVAAPRACSASGTSWPPPGPAS